MALSQLLKKKLKDAGIRSYAQTSRRLAEHLLKEGDAPFEWGKGDPERIIHISFDEKDAADLSEISKGITGDLASIILKLANQFSDEITRKCEKDWKASRYVEERAQRTFRNNLEDRWGNGLDALRILLEYSRQLGERTAQRFTKSKARKGRNRQMALIRAHIRACQVSAETLTLLENGFADGAMARWRTLHEIAMVTVLLSDGDDDLSARYLDHEHVDAKKSLDQFIEDSTSLGFSLPSTREIKSTNRAFERVINKHGKPFRHEYGWASEHLNMERPRFIDIQKFAGRSSMRSQYKTASHAVHATSIALGFRFADIWDEGSVHAGASNGGLEKAGIRLAESLALITFNLPKQITNIDHAINMSILVNLRDNAISELDETAKLLLADDRAIRRALRGIESDCFS